MRRQSSQSWYKTFVQPTDSFCPQRLNHNKINTPTIILLLINNVWFSWSIINTEQEDDKKMMFAFLDGVQNKRTTSYDNFNDDDETHPHSHL